MKITKSFCRRCGKLFDFDLYSGLCPHCGCFHRAPGVTTNNVKMYVKPEKGTAEAEFQKHLKADAKKGVDHGEHKSTAADPHIEQMKKNAEKKVTYSEINKSSSKKTTYKNEKRTKGNNKLLRFCLLIFVAFLFLSNKFNSFSIDDLPGIDTVRNELSDMLDFPTEDSSIVYIDEDMGDVDNLEPGRLICGGDYSYYVVEAITIGDADDIADISDEFAIPEGTKLIAVNMDMYYDGKPLYDENAYIMPGVYDGVAYNGCVLVEDMQDVLDAYGLKDYSLDPKEVYSNSSEDGEYNSGYLYYIVDEGCSEIDLYLEFASNGEHFSTGSMKVEIDE